MGIKIPESVLNEMKCCSCGAKPELKRMITLNSKFFVLCPSCDMASYTENTRQKAVDSWHEILLEEL